MARIRKSMACLALLLVVAGACAEPTSVAPVAEPQMAAIVVQRGTVSCTVPDDYVVLRVIFSNACGVYGTAYVVDLPRRMDVVCSAPPRGFVVVEQLGATGACNPKPTGTNFASTIKLPGAEEWICTTLAAIPGNYTLSQSAQSPTCGKLGYGWQYRSRVRWIRTSAVQSPIGRIESIGAGGLVIGWVCQPDHPALNTEIHLYANAPWPGGRAFAAFRTRLAAEAAVADRCNGNGTYRFRHQLTAAQLRQLGPGKHAVYAHGIDFDGGTHPVIGPVHTLTVPR